MAAEPDLLASHRLRIAARLARWGLWLVLALWLALLGAWGVLNGVIVPRIGEWRPGVEQAASRALGVPVRVGQLVAHPAGLFPSLELRDVVVLDAQSQAEALRLSRVVVTLSARSVLRLGLEQLYIDAPDLDVRRLPDGGWRVAGFEIGPSQEQPDLDGSPAGYRALQWLLDQPEVALRNGTLRWTDGVPPAAAQPVSPDPLDEQPGAQEVTMLELRDVDIVVRNTGWRHALRLDATSASGGQRLHAVGLFRESLLANAREAIRPDDSLPPWQRWSGQWFAHLGVDALPGVTWPPQWGIAAVQGAGQVRVWGDVQHGQVMGVTADVAMDHVRVDWQARAAPPARTSMSAAASASVPVAPLLASTRASTRTASSAAPFAVSQLQGRLAAQWQPESWAVQASQLGFAWRDSGTGRLRQWPRSDWQLQVSGLGAASGRAGVLPAPGGEAQQASAAVPDVRLSLDYADLGLAAGLLGSLPLAQALHDPLGRMAAAGQIHQLRARWHGAHYQAEGQLRHIAVAAQPAADGGVGVPGVRGLHGEFRFNEREGHAQLTVRDGRLELPGVFEDPAIALQRLDTRLHWTVQQGRWRLQVSDTTFANADAQGRLQAIWHMGDTPQSRLPGTLELSGSLDRVDGTRVHRYLPLAMDADARAHVRDSVRAGEGRNVRFEAAGDLRRMPFDDLLASSTPAAAGAGAASIDLQDHTRRPVPPTSSAPDAPLPPVARFYIEAPLSGVTYDYTPPGQPAWPVLHDAAALLVVDGLSLHVRRATGSVLGQPQLRITAGQASIADLNHPRLALSLQAAGPLPSMLHLAGHGALNEVTGGAFGEAVARGDASLTLALDMPLEQPERATVRGQVQLQDNAVRLFAHMPMLHDVRGSVRFHEQGFELHDVQARTLGGRVRLGGGMPSLAAGLHVHVRGHATASGLQSDAAQTLVRQLARHARGSTAYAADVRLPAGATQPEVTVRSDLQGMALALPAPLDKSEAAALPLTVRYGPILPATVAAPLTLASAQTAAVTPFSPSSSASAPVMAAGAATAELVQYHVRIGGRGQLDYLIDTATTPPRVRSGSIALGAHAPIAPLDELAAQHGVTATVHLPALDVDAWVAALSDWDATEQGQEEEGKGAQMPDTFIPSVTPPAAQLAGVASADVAPALDPAIGSSTDSAANTAVPALADAAGAGKRGASSHNEARTQGAPAVRMLAGGPGGERGQGQGHYSQAHLPQSAPSPAPVVRDAADNPAAYLPRHITLQVGSLRAWRRELGGIKGQVKQSYGEWGGQIQAQQFAGELRYRQPDAAYPTGLVHARLAYLSVPQAQIDALDTAPASLADGLADTGESHDNLPALDIQVDALEISDRPLGRLILQARNLTGQEGHWDLQRLQLHLPHARLTASGRWVASAPAGERRRTQMGFVLDMHDSGKLLEHMGMPGVIRDGKGQITGQVGWRGSPASPHWPSMRGDLRLDIGKGQFLKVDPGAAKLLSVLSLQSLARRLTLDFRDVFGKGFAFDFVRGHVTVDAGIARASGLQMQGLNATVLMEGTANLMDETQDLRVVVVPEINAMTASLLAAAVNPVVGLGSFLAQLALRGPMMEAATRTFHVTGTWADPVVEPGNAPAPAP